MVLFLKNDTITTMKKVAVLGSTGFIGRSSLKVIQHLQGKVSVLAAKSAIDVLEEQAKVFKPELIAVWDEKKAQILQKRLPHIPVVGGREGMKEAACHSSVELLLNAISGFEGIEPSICAVQAGKDVALANKETLVAAGSLVTHLARKNGVALIPIDSEHTAIFQCLKGENPKEVRRIILTASGGPFREHSLEYLSTVTVEETLSHPHYVMSPKGTVDSSTLMNKGFEMIETYFLYGIPVEKIEVVIHPEQIIHSMVEFVDYSIMAQMGKPEMFVPIQVALTHPIRYEGIIEPFDFKKNYTLQFAPWDAEKFLCLQLAYDALKEGGSKPCFMNAANDVLVRRFLSSEISFIEIGKKLETLMQSHTVGYPSQFEDLVSIDLEARKLAQRI